MDQIQTGLARLLGSACRHDDDCRIRNVIIVTCVNTHRTYQGSAVADIHCLAFRLVMIDVQQDHFRKQTALHDCECTGCADKPATDHSYFTMINTHRYFSFPTVSVSSIIKQDIAGMPLILSPDGILFSDTQCYRFRLP